MRSVKSRLCHHLPHLQQKMISRQQAQIQIRFQGQKQIGGEPIQIELYVLSWWLYAQQRGTVSNRLNTRQSSKTFHQVSPESLSQTDVTKTGNGEWGMGNGEWGMGNGEWGMGNGEWGMGNREWGMRNSGQR